MMTNASPHKAKPAAACFCFKNCAASYKKMAADAEKNGTTMDRKRSPAPLTANIASIKKIFKSRNRSRGSPFLRATLTTRYSKEIIMTANKGGDAVSESVLKISFRLLQ